MGSKFGSELTKLNKVTNLKIVGVIDEDNELVDLETRLGAGFVVIDLAEIDRINSSGVRDWVNWLARLEKRGVQLVFVNCSPVTVSQFNLVHNFGANGIVKSFYAPYYCPRCEKEKLLLLETCYFLEHVPVSLPPTCRCDECDGPMDFDGMEDSYFAFLNNIKKVYRDLGYETILREMPWVEQSRDGAVPDTRPTLQRSPAPKIPLSPPLLRKLIQTVLPTDADFRGFCIDYFPQLQVRLSDGMDRLRQVNILLETEGLEPITEQLRRQAFAAKRDWNTLLHDLQATVSPEADQARERLDKIDQLYDERDVRQIKGIATHDINEQIRGIKRELHLAPTLQEREVLGERYCLLQVVGRGGFASVWKARDRKTHRVVAVKVLHADQGEDTRRMDRFLRGAERMQQLNHPHIAGLSHPPAQPGCKHGERK